MHVTTEELMCYCKCECLYEPRISWSIIDFDDQFKLQLQQLATDARSILTYPKSVSEHVKEVFYFCLNNKCSKTINIEFLLLLKKITEFKFLQ